MCLSVRAKCAGGDSVFMCVWAEGGSVYVCAGGVSVCVGWGSKCVCVCVLKVGGSVRTVCVHPRGVVTGVAGAVIELSNYTPC